jgi:hypothetical protein
MADFHIEPGHLWPGRDIPELWPGVAPEFTTGELGRVWVSPDIEKLRLPRGAQCAVLSGEHTEIHLSDRFRGDCCEVRSLKGQEGSTLDVSVCHAEELFIQYLRLRASTVLPDDAPFLSVERQGLVGAIWVQDPVWLQESEYLAKLGSAHILGPRSGPGKLAIGMMDQRHTREGNVEGNVQVTKFLSDREIAVKIGPLSGRQQRGPQDPPGEQRHRSRGYKP